MADGDYERRQGREAEIKRLQRIIREQAERRALPRHEGRLEIDSVRR